MDTQIKKKYIVKLIHSLLRLESKIVMINTYLFNTPTPTVIQYFKKEYINVKQVVGA